MLSTRFVCSCLLAAVAGSLDVVNAQELSRLLAASATQGERLASQSPVPQRPAPPSPTPAPASAGAQDEAQSLDRFNRRIPAYVVDLRAMLPKVPKNEALAQPYGVAGPALPGLGLGIEAGLHVYPVRRKTWALGVGASAGLAGAKASQKTDDEGNVEGADVSVRFRALSPQVSINFGTAAGWSYLSGGLGFSNLTLDTPTTPETVLATRRKTINYGGGGRWFFRDHLAFTLDLRLYAINPVAADLDVLPSPRVTMMVISVGASFR